MRLGNSYWSTAAILTALACSESSGVPGPAASGCGAGQELCNGQCVATGTCDDASAGGASSTTKSSKVNSTGGKTSSAKGGTTQAEGGDQNGEGGQGDGGSSDEPVATGGSSKGGTSAGKGGTSAGKGGTSATAKGGTSAVAKGGTSATAKGGTTSTWVDDPTKCDDKSTTTGTLADQYLKRMIVIQDPNRNYAMHTNWWGKYVDQSVTVNGLGFTLTKNSASSADGSTPIGFPSIFIGKYQKIQTTGSNLPKQVSAIKSVPTLLESSVGNGEVNISYDVWFTGSSAPLGDTDNDPGASGRLLMVWLSKPGSKSPRGTQNGTASIAGHTWAVWQDTSNKAPCRSYVAQPAVTSLSQFDLNEFIKHAVSAGFLTNSMYLSVVFAGTEVWSGGSGTAIKNFCVKVY